MTPAPVAPAGGAGVTPGAATGSAPDRFLEVRNLVKEFPAGGGGLLRRGGTTVKAVSGVSFSVARGETFGLVGESGSGKTTIARMIVGLERPTSGDVCVDGSVITALSRRELRRRRRDMQLIFQDPYSSLDPRMRVGAIVAEPMTIQHAGSRQHRHAEVRRLLREVGLDEETVERYPHELSGGQRQRVGLARALALNPRLVVADEPVSALDVSIRAQILNLMNELQGTHGLTYLVISHDLSVVRYVADRVGVMYLGKLAEIGSARDIYARAAHPYTVGLIAAIPIPDPLVERSKRAETARGELPSPIHPPSGCRYRTRCPRAQKLCADDEPPLRPFGPGHLAACHFPMQPPIDDGRAAAGPSPSEDDPSAPARS